MSQIISILNQKGGTAKTTTAVSISSRLGLMGKRVLLIDLDPQANATMSFGVDPYSVDRSTFDLLVRELPLEDVVLTEVSKGLDLIPGHVALSETDINLADRDRSQFYLKDAIERHDEEYEYIVIDCPPSFGLLPVNALVASTGVLIPMVPQYFSLEGLKEVNRSVQKIRAGLNPDLESVGILFCAVDMRLKITKPSMEMVCKHFGDRVVSQFIHTSSKINESHLAGCPIFNYAPQSRAAKEYSSVTEDFIKRFASQKKSPKRFSFIKGLITPKQNFES